MKKSTRNIPVLEVPKIKTKVLFYLKGQTDLAHGTVDQENCKHFASLSMPRLKNKRECVICQKVFDDE